jgi:hypothetical protein
MHWFRYYHGLCTDPKLHRIARAAGVRRHVVIAAWCAILEQASMAEDRGSVSELDASSLAFLIDTSKEVATRVLAQITNSGMLTSTGRVNAWEKRQPASDDVTTRVRSHRERKANPLKDNDPPTGGNVTGTNRTDKNREDKIDSALRTESSSPAGAGDAQKTAPKLNPFERFWAAYPRRVGRGAAEKKFDAAIRHTDIASLLAGVERYVANKPAHQDWCHPATWLHQQRWLDEERVGQGEGAVVHQFDRLSGNRRSVVDAVNKLTRWDAADVAGNSPGFGEADNRDPIVRLVSFN